MSRIKFTKVKEVTIRKRVLLTSEGSYNKKRDQKWSDNFINFTIVCQIIGAFIFRLLALTKRGQELFCTYICSHVGWYFCQLLATFCGALSYTSHLRREGSQWYQQIQCISTTKPLKGREWFSKIPKTCPKNVSTLIPITI